ncbi:hypothetical protein Bbelb_394210 [Branchiostoma belcheri]|nr:hypothetical protein Bbelb_394210 [Branchiostoma belcheri]
MTIGERSRRSQWLDVALFGNGQRTRSQVQRYRRLKTKEATNEATNDTSRQESDGTPACRSTPTGTSTSAKCYTGGTRPVPGQSPVLTRAACGRVPTGSYSSAGQLSGPWRVPGGIPTGSSRVFEQAGACAAARRVPGSEVTALLRRISPNGARSVFNSELKSIRRPRGAKNRPAAVGKPAGLRPGPHNTLPEGSMQVRILRVVYRKGVGLVTSADESRRPRMNQEL